MSTRQQAGFWLAAATVLSLTFVQAQEAKPLPRHPGDVLKFEVKFDGPDADKVTSVNMNFGITSPRLTDQTGFNGGFNGSSGSQIAPKTFHVEATIPENIATGDYTLNSISAGASPGGTSYGRSDFQTFTFRIESPKTFTAPKITVKELP